LRLGSGLRKICSSSCFPYRGTQLGGWLYPGGCCRVSEGRKTARTEPRTLRAGWPSAAGVLSVTSSAKAESEIGVTDAGGWKGPLGIIWSDPLPKQGQILKQIKPLPPLDRQNVLTLK